MKNQFRLLIYGLFYLTFSHAAVHAQCPPPGFPAAADVCANAPLVCTNIDGYCGTLSTNDNPQLFPGCPANVLNNDEYIRFVAASSTLVLQVTPSNCQGTIMQIGMQGAIFDECSGAVLATQCFCTAEPFLLATDDLVVGKAYTLVLDGCAGDVCDYSIQILQGSTNPDDVTLMPFGQLLGPAKACTKEILTYTLETDPDGQIYFWTTMPADAALIHTSPGEPIATVRWNAEGNYKLCVAPGNACGESLPPTCIAVVVSDEPVADTVEVSICQGDCFELPNGELACTQGTYQVLLEDTLSCDTLRSYVVTEIPPSETVLPPIVLCDSTYQFCQGVVLDSSGSYELNCPSVNGCDSIVSFQLTLLDPHAIIAPPQPLCLPGVLLDGSASLFSDGEDLQRQVQWQGPPGGLIPGSDSLVAIAALPGTYCLTIIEEKLSTTCSHTTCVEVKGQPLTTLPELLQLCTGDTVILGQGLPPFESYSWSTGDTTATIPVYQKGEYALQAIDSTGCFFQGSVTVQVDEQPQLIAEFIDSLCLGETVLLSAAEGFAKYLWNTGDTTAQIIAEEPGMYSITATTAGGCQVLDSIWVQGFFPPSIDLPDEQICDNLPNGYSAPEGFTSYLWSTGDTTRTVFLQETGTYYLTVTNGAGCTAVDSITVVDFLSDVLSLPDTLVLCNQSSPVLLVMPPGYDYSWSDGQTGDSVFLQAWQTYSVTLSDASGCTEADTFFLTAKPFIDMPAQVSVCPNELPIKIGPNNTFATYQWSNGLTSSHIFALAGTYSLTVTDFFGCTNSASITVLKEPAASVEITGQSNACEEDFPVTLTASGNFDLVSWSSGQQTKTIKVTGPGSFSVTVTNGFGCTATDDIVVTKLPEPQFPPSLHDTTVCRESLPITFDAGFDKVFYLWSTGEQTPTITIEADEVPQPGFYSFSVLVENIHGCQAVKSFVLEVRLCSATSQTDLPGTLGIVPNPTSGRAWLVYAGLPVDEYELACYASDGRLIFSENIQLSAPDGRLELSLDEAPTGVYYIRISSPMGVRMLRLVRQ